MKVVYSLEQAQEYFWHNLGVECVCVRFDGAERKERQCNSLLEAEEFYAGVQP